MRGGQCPGHAGFSPPCTLTPSGPTATAGSAPRLPNTPEPTRGQHRGQSRLQHPAGTPLRALRDPSLRTSKESWWQLYFEFDVSFGLSTPKDTQDILSQRPALSVPAAPHLWDRVNPRARREPQHPRRAPLAPNSPPGFPRAAPGFTALSADPHSPCWPHGRRGAARRRTAAEPTAKRRREER